MLGGQSINNALRTLVLSADRLKALSLPGDVLNPLMDYASLVTLRRHLGENRPPFFGFIGCTGTGKSTLFNSLIGQEVSLTGWKVHNTCGPVLFMPDRVLKLITQWETESGPLLLPSLKREIYSADKQSALYFEKQKTGSSDTLHLFGQSDDSRSKVDPQEFGSFVFIDLPDINSSPAFEESLVALKVLPWLDIVLFMVDDETLFHRIYENAVQAADELGQQRYCVLSNRGKDRVDVDHPDVKHAMRFFGVDEIHILPELIEKACFDNEASFIRLKQTMAENRKLSPSRPLVRRISRLAQKALEENTKREGAFKSLEKEISMIINTAIAKDAPISLEKILHDDVLQVLNHLGLKRFAISNLLNFFKVAAASRSLKHSFRLSFGSRRDSVLSPNLQFDPERFAHEVYRRLADHQESILLAIRRHPEIDVLQKVKPTFNTWFRRVTNTGAGIETSQSFNEELGSIVKKFEQRCADLIASDSVSSAIQNDPLVAAFLVAALVADAFAIPGFGSWFLVPTVFRYLPLGKFETAKKSFQHDVKGFIQRQLLRITTELHDIRLQTVLAGADPILKSLNVCAQNDD